MESWSRKLPPGCTIAVIPAAAAVLTVSSKGKKPSLAKTAPLVPAPACSRAILVEPTRFIWPAPTPKVVLCLLITIALDLTCLQTFQANSNSANSSGVGLTLVTTCHLALSAIVSSAVCTRRPPAIALTVSFGPLHRSGKIKTRTLPFLFKISCAS